MLVASAEPAELRLRLSPALAAELAQSGARPLVDVSASLPGGTDSTARVNPHPFPNPNINPNPNPYPNPKRKEEEEA